MKEYVEFVKWCEKYGLPQTETVLKLYAYYRDLGIENEIIVIDIKQ